jgi:hypothetical protein
VPDPQTLPDSAASVVQEQVSGADWFWKLLGQAAAAAAGAATVNDARHGP